jgi:hypothetical protein
MEFNDKIEIYWLDAVIDSDWLKLEEVKAKPPDADTLSMGYYSYEDDEGIYISPSAGPDENSRRTRHFIPKGCIKSIRRLTYEESENKS